MAQANEKKTEAQEDNGSAKTNKKVVTFVKPWSRYTRGDVAGFEPKEADRLVKSKIAIAGEKSVAAPKGEAEGE